MISFSVFVLTDLEILKTDLQLLIAVLNSGPSSWIYFTLKFEMASARQMCSPHMLHIIITINTGVVCAVGAAWKNLARYSNHSGPKITSEAIQSPLATIRTWCMIVYIINQPRAKSANRPLLLENYSATQAGTHR